MIRYLQFTSADRQAMLAAIGVGPHLAQRFQQTERDDLSHDDDEQCTLCMGCFGNR